MAVLRWSLPAGGLLLGWLCLALPSLWDFLFGTWSAYSQGHEPLLLVVAGWLLWRHVQEVPALPAPRLRAGFWLLWAAGVLAYGVGRSQEFIRVELLSVWALGILLVYARRGWPGLRHTWFAWLFCLFAMPLPFSVVLALTAPLKEAVSVLATHVLAAVGYPVGRSGVVITVGQYQLLVAEACAGLQSMFILEAMGLLYSHLVNHTSWVRNAMLALFAIPVSFVANVMRVMILVLVTHHFGDAAGQGFVHNFAGLVLFAVALVLMALVDLALGLVWPDRAPGVSGSPSGSAPVAVAASSITPNAAVAMSPQAALGGGAAGRMSVSVGVLLGSLVLIAGLSAWWRPGVSDEAEARARTPLESLFPSQVGEWRLDPLASGVVRPAFEQAKQFQMYDQVLERTYLHPSGQRIMLSVAYGRQQSVGLQMHRPEVCYRAGGFRVGQIETGQLDVLGRPLTVKRLMADMPKRPEPITYWRLLGNEVVSDEGSFRLNQLVGGLAHRRVADGLLVRVSSIQPNVQAGWALQASFVRDLALAMSPMQRERVLGWAQAVTRP